MKRVLIISVFLFILAGCSTGEPQKADNKVPVNINSDQEMEEEQTPEPIKSDQVAESNNKINLEEREEVELMEDRVEEKIDKLLIGFYNFEKRTEENFSKLNDRMSNLESRMDSLENRMENLESRMDSLENRMNSLENRMDSLESNMDNLDKNINSRFDTLEKRIRSIKGIVGENMADIADINKRIEKQIS